MIRGPDIKFANDEPAAVIRAGGKRYIVVGDLHIGRELSLSGKGIHIYGTTESMAERILRLSRRFRIKRVIIIGDVKDSILYPIVPEKRLIEAFFERLGGLEVTVVAGNHDARIGEIKKVKMVRELTIGRFGLAHGNGMPSDRLMLCDYIITGHEHPAFFPKTADGENAGPGVKAWMILKINPKIAARFYKRFNKDAYLISMPAFNDLILGSDIESEKSLNPLIRKGIFDRRTARIYNQKGSILNFSR